MGKIRKTLSSLLVGAYLLSPSAGFARPEVIFNRTEGNLIARASLDSEENILRFEVANIKTRQPINRPDIYLIHSKEVEVQISRIEERGRLVPQNKIVELKHEENTAYLLKKGADFALGFLGINTKKLQKISELIRKDCETNPDRIIKEIKKRNYSVTEIPKYAEGMNVAGIEHIIPFNTENVVGTARVSLLAKLNFLTKSSCVGFEFNLEGKKQRKEGKKIFSVSPRRLEDYFFDKEEKRKGGIKGESKYEVIGKTDLGGGWSSIEGLERMGFIDYAISPRISYGRLYILEFESARSKEKYVRARTGLGYPQFITEKFVSIFTDGLDIDIAHKRMSREDEKRYINLIFNYQKRIGAELILERYEKEQSEWRRYIERFRE